jgi:long-chain acyl-CoA synthetase
VRRDTLIDFFHDLAGTPGEFLVYDDAFRSRSFSYRDVGRAARAFAARLAAAGLRKGDTVVFFSENRPEWIVAFWGCLLVGVVVVPIDYRASPDFLARVTRIVRAKVIVVGQDVLVPADAAGTEIWPLSDIDWTDAPAPDVVIGRDDVAEIIFTSGATAEPKGVVITHRNVLANIVPVEREVRKYRTWGTPFFPLRFLNLLPLSHMFGQAMATFIPPMLPGVVVFMRGYNPGEIVAQIKARRVSVLVSVPKILDVLREYVLRAAPGSGVRGPRRHVLLRWWRHRRVHRMFGLKFWAFVVGAAPLEAALEEFWGELGFAVIQGYGLTETAPIVSLNHPFGTRRGSVGKAIAGVEVKIAPDGEILVRGENVTSGYYHADEETARAFEGGWFHTGDIGDIASDGQIYIRGRKKEMIVTPEGLNVFPEDVERVLDAVPGVRESAVVGLAGTPGEPGGRVGGDERVHAVLVVDPGTDPETVVRTANAALADHQKIRRAALWPGPALPRTEGTRKLKRAMVRDWLKSGGLPTRAESAPDPLASLVAKYSGRTDLAPGTTIDELGLSSLERVELMVALEDRFQTRLDEGAFAGARDISALRTLVERAAAGGRPPDEPVDFPVWNRSWLARAVRRVSLPTWILPLARLFAWIHVEGLEQLRAIDGPVIFAANHQSHLDVPVVLGALPARLRYRVAPAMAKEFFKAHFFPQEYGRAAWATNSLNYYLAALFFNAFPLPQREAGARQTLRYIGDMLDEGFSVLIFPEGKRTEGGEISPFRPGVGMMASRLGVPVVPVRLEGLDRVLHHTWRMARPGRVRVAFGAPMRLTGDDFEALAARVGQAVGRL